MVVQVVAFTLKQASSPALLGGEDVNTTYPVSPIECMESEPLGVCLDVLGPLSIFCQRENRALAVSDKCSDTYCRTRGPNRPSVNQVGSGNQPTMSTAIS